MGFCNSTIKPLREGKPHICMRQGYWRVSKMPKLCSAERREHYYLAHVWTTRPNNTIQWLTYVENPVPENRRKWRAYYYE